MSESSKEDVFNFLLANQDFREWVANPTEERTQYWHKWISNNKEHEEVVEQAKSTLQKLKFKEEFLQEDRLEDILTKIISEEPSEQITAKKRKLKSKRVWLAAATVSLFAVLVFILNVGNKDQDHTEVTYRTVSNPKGQKSKLKLPDGTLVNLNAGSALVFPDQFSNEHRSVEIKGEAFFTVSHDEGRPFVVSSDSVSVTVLGTSFNFRNYAWEDQVDVALVAGKLSVKSLSHKNEMILMPGEKASINRQSGELIRSEFSNDSEVGWRQNILVFENASFDQFIEQLEHWYGVDIQIEGTPSSEWSVNGHFDDESLEEILIGVQFSYRMDYHIIGKKVRLVIK